MPRLKILRAYFLYIPLLNTVNQLFMDKEIEGTYRIERTTSQEDTKNIARKYAQSGEKAIIYA